jgi:anti-sigma factor RsiW
LIRVVAGEADAVEAREVERHLRECRRCADTRNRLQATWDALAVWTESEPAADLWPAIHASLEVGARRNAGWLPRSTPGLLRAAASVLIAIGLGWATGAVIGQRDASPPEPPVASIDEVMESLGLDTLTLGAAAGLQTVFEETDEAGPEEDS